MPEDIEEIKKKFDPRWSAVEGANLAYRRFQGLIRRAFPQRKSKPISRGTPKLVDPNDPKIREGVRRAWGR
jgi:hypothetical protein